MKSYIKSIIFLGGILAGGNYVCGTEDNQKKKMPEPKENITIIATFKIDEGHANEGVRIINDSKCARKNTRTGIDSIEIYKLGNNNEHQFEYIAGKVKNGEIDKKYKFKKPGEYEIYYYFEEGITDMSYMFYQCSYLTSLDFSNFNTKNVTNMSFMFYMCSSLTNLNISKFNTENVTDMACMFDRCSSLTTLNLSSFNTEKVTDMSYMFYGCSYLTTLSLSSFNTNSVTSMPEMFSGCTSLKTLDLSNFNTDSANYRDRLLDGCSSLEEVTTNDGYIKSLCKDKKVNVLPPNKKEVNIEIVDNQNLLNKGNQEYGFSHQNGQNESKKLENENVSNEPIVIVDNQNLLNDNSHTKSKFNCWCCPCCKDR